MNVISIVGRLTKDPEHQKVGSDKSLAKFTLAVDRNYSSSIKQQREKENKPTADFLDVVAWGHTADFISTFGFKGAKASVVGKVESYLYTNSDGEIRKSFTIVANEVNILEKQNKFAHVDREKEKEILQSNKPTPEDEDSSTDALFDLNSDEAEDDFDDFDEIDFESGYYKDKYTNAAMEEYEKTQKTEDENNEDDEDWNNINF